MCSLAALSLECPQCGAPIERTESVCTYCHSPFFVKRIGDLQSKSNIEVSKYLKAYQQYLKNEEGYNKEAFMALGLCHLNNRSFERAIESFNKVIDVYPDYADAYFYCALAQLKGKRPYLQTLSNVKNILQLLDTAIEYDSKGRYYYLLSFIQCDFYEKKRLRSGRNSEELKRMAFELEIDDVEIMEINEFCNLG